MPPVEGVGSDHMQRVVADVGEARRIIPVEIAGEGGDEDRRIALIGIDLAHAGVAAVDEHALGKIDGSAARPAGIRRRVLALGHADFITRRGDGQRGSNLGERVDPG